MGELIGYTGLALGLVALLLGALWCGAMIDRRFQKHEPDPTPTHAVLRAKPGATLDLVHEDGRVVAKVVLTNITYSGSEGTTAQFEDYFRWMNRNSFPRGLF